jgi:hypothetical protein
MGRPKGSQNRRTLDIEQRLDRIGCDPIEGLARIGRQAEEEGDLRLAADCYRHLAPYIAPRLSAAAITTDNAPEDLAERMRAGRERARRA